MSGYEGFAPVYDAWAADMTEDVDFYVRLAREADGPVVELAAGTGRISIPIVERTGNRVVGLDLSPAMLARARENAAEAGVELELHEADMREVGRSEWEGLLEVSGLETEALYGWFDRSPFDDSSREFVWVARKLAA